MIYLIEEMDLVGFIDLVWKSKISVLLINTDLPLQ